MSDPNAKDHARDPLATPSERTSSDDARDPGDGDGNSRADLTRLADTSDRLLAEIRDLRDAENRKRRTSISTPEFHRLAREVEERSLRVWSEASEQRSLSSELETEPGVTTEDAEALRDSERVANGKPAGDGEDD